MSNPVLLMVHGLIGSLGYYDPESYLRAAAAVQTCDLLGYGAKRDFPGSGLTLESQVGHVFDRIAEFDSPRVWLLGHSMGGAIVMMLADRRPEMVAGIINVEGNFTLKDAFWSRKIALQSSEDWTHEYAEMRRNVPGWLERCGIEPRPQRIEWATHILDHQPARTVFAMSQALITETGKPGYLEGVQRVIERGIPIHLIAGARSAAKWDVPNFVRTAARSYVEIPNAGHLMMLEAPDAFCAAVDQALIAS